MEVGCVHTTTISPPPPELGRVGLPPRSSSRHEEKSSKDLRQVRLDRRRKKKQMSERDRRGKITKWLTKLQQLMYGTSSRDHLKVDKATVLMDATDKLENMQGEYNRGYESAMDSIRSFVDSMASCPQEVKESLVSHLTHNRQINHQKPMASSLGAPSTSTPRTSTPTRGSSTVAGLSPVSRPQSGLAGSERDLAGFESPAEVMDLSSNNSTPRPVSSLSSRFTEATREGFGLDNYFTNRADPLVSGDAAAAAASKASYFELARPRRHQESSGILCYTGQSCLPFSSASDDEMAPFYPRHPQHIFDSESSPPSKAVAQADKDSNRRLEPKDLKMKIRLEERLKADADAPTNYKLHANAEHNPFTPPKQAVPHIKRTESLEAGRDGLSSKEAQQLGNVPFHHYPSFFASTPLTAAGVPRISPYVTPYAPKDMYLNLSYGATGDVLYGIHSDAPHCSGGKVASSPYTPLLLPFLHPLAPSGFYPPPTASSPSTTSTPPSSCSSSRYIRLDDSGFVSFVSPATTPRGYPPTQTPSKLTDTSSLNPPLSSSKQSSTPVLERKTRYSPLTQPQKKSVYSPQQPQIDSSVKKIYSPATPIFPGGSARGRDVVTAAAAVFEAVSDDETDKEVAQVFSQAR